MQAVQQLRRKIHRSSKEGKIKNCSNYCLLLEITKHNPFKVCTLGTINYCNLKNSFLSASSSTIDYIESRFAVKSSVLF